MKYNSGREFFTGRESGARKEGGYPLFGSCLGPALNATRWCRWRLARAPPEQGSFHAPDPAAAAAPVSFRQAGLEVFQMIIAPA